MMMIKQYNFIAIDLLIASAIVHGGISKRSWIGSLQPSDQIAILLSVPNFRNDKCKKRWALAEQQKYIRCMLGCGAKWLPLEQLTAKFDPLPQGQTTQGRTHQLPLLTDHCLLLTDH